MLHLSVRVSNEKLAGTNAEIKVWNNKDSDFYYETLSLRQYASLLFGYLCTIGVVYIIVYIILDNVNFGYVAGKNLFVVENFAIILTIFFVAHYAFLSVYSITFLFEKINKIGERQS